MVSSRCTTFPLSTTAMFSSECERRFAQMNIILTSTRSFLLVETTVLLFTRMTETSLSSPA